jgi:hypothetical protein
MSQLLKGLPRIGPATVVPVPLGQVPPLKAWVILGYTLGGRKWVIYDHGRLYGSLEEASAAAADLPSVYVNIHLMAVELAGGKVGVESEN